MASRSTRGARGTESSYLDIHAKTNVRDLLAEIKEIDPALATALRRRLRQSADDAIDEMKGILSAPAPGVVTKRNHGLGMDRRGRVRRVVTSVDSRAGAGRSRGSRAYTASRLKVAVRTGARPSSQGVRLTGAGDPFSRSYNLIRWRHPVRFNPATTMKSQVPWVEQAGTRYFHRGLGKDDNYRRIYRNVGAAIEDAQAALAGR